jgi:hypothetical protein
MIWVLVWFQVTNSQGIDYYQLSNHSVRDDCIAAMEQAQVLVTHQGEAVACLEVKVK